jgi:hypothetical protein
MPPAELEPAIPASEVPHTYTLDNAPLGSEYFKIEGSKIKTVSLTSACLLLLESRFILIPILIGVYESASLKICGSSNDTGFLL